MASLAQYKERTENVGLSRRVSENSPEAEAFDSRTSHCLDAELLSPSSDFNMDKLPSSSTASSSSLVSYAALSLPPNVGNSPSEPEPPICSSRNIFRSELVTREYSSNATCPSMNFHPTEDSKLLERLFISPSDDVGLAHRTADKPRVETLDRDRVFDSTIVTSARGLFTASSEDRNHLGDVILSERASAKALGVDKIGSYPFPCACGISFPPYFLEDKNESADYESSDGGTTEACSDSFVAVQVLDAKIAVITRELFTAPPPGEDLHSSPSISDLSLSSTAKFELPERLTSFPHLHPYPARALNHGSRTPVPSALSVGRMRCSIHSPLVLLVRGVSPEIIGRAKMSASAKRSASVTL